MCEGEDIPRSIHVALTQHPQSRSIHVRVRSESPGFRVIAVVWTTSCARRTALIIRVMRVVRVIRALRNP